MAATFAPSLPRVASSISLHGGKRRLLLQSHHPLGLLLPSESPDWGACRGARWMHVPTWKAQTWTPCSVRPHFVINAILNVTCIFFPLKTDKKCIQEPVTKLHGRLANAPYLHMTNYAFIHCLKVWNSLLVVNFLLEHTDGPAWSC